MEVLLLLRASARALLRRPGYTILVVATLAVGIGGATAIFSLVHGVLLRPLPWGEPERLVTLEVRDANTGHGISLSIPNYRDWEERNRVFDRIGAAAGWGFVRETPEGAERLDAQIIVGDLFGTLGMEAALGRLIPGEETGLSAPPSVVLGHGFWTRAFGADPAVVGRALVLEGQPYTIVGVLPPGVGYPRPDVEAYVPMGFLAAANPTSLPWDIRSSSFGTRAVARLADGVSLASAQEDMDRITAEVDALEGKPVVTAEVVTLRRHVLGGVERALWLLMAGVGLVLLIGGANVANLAFARSEERGAELAVRRALGAGPGEVTRILVTESVMLALLGGGVGLLLASGAAGLLPRVLPLTIPAVMAQGLAMGAPVVGFALALTALAALLFAFVPAARAAAGSSLPGSGARSTDGRSGRRTRDVLVVAQVALSLVLLVASGLLLGSLSRLASVDKGFSEGGVVSARLAQPRGAFAGGDAWLAFYEQVAAELDATPEVERTAFALLTPLSGRSWERNVLPEEAPFVLEEAPSVLFNVVSEPYFEVMGTPVLRGRTFGPADVNGSEPVVIIDATMAERFWPGEDPLGRRITIMESPTNDPTPASPDEVVWRTVVGVVANVRHYELGSPSRVQAYVPMRQALGVTGVSLTVLARAAGDPTPVPGLVRRTVARQRTDIPVIQNRFLSDFVADQLGPGRALGVTTTLFGATAALLAALGIFGVLTLSVARRRREIGIRMAVGATSGDVVGLVLRHGMGLVGLGTLIGIGGAGLGASTLSTFLYEVSPWAPTVYLGAALLLAVVGAAAALAPAARASRTPPVRVLRQE